MNDTNRAFNRTVLIVIGVVLIALGAAVVAIFTWPVAGDLWTSSTELGRSWIEDAVAASQVGFAAASGVAIGILVLILLVIALLIVALVRLGGGRTNTLLSAGSTRSDIGTVQVRGAFASDAMHNALHARDDLLITSVTSHRVRSQAVMHVRIIPRQNTSPRRVADDVDRLATNLATLTGEQIPTYISIHSGLRARLAKDERRLA